MRGTRGSPICRSAKVPGWSQSENVSSVFFIAVFSLNLQSMYMKCYIIIYIYMYIRISYTLHIIYMYLYIQSGYSISRVGSVKKTTCLSAGDFPAVDFLSSGNEDGTLFIQP